MLPNLALADDNIQVVTEPNITTLENTTTEVSMNFTNLMNVSAAVAVYGNPARPESASLYRSK